MNHVTSLEISKRLKEAGYPQSRLDTAQYWVLLEDGNIELFDVEYWLNTRGAIPIAYAPSLGELIRELPFYRITNWGDDYSCTSDDIHPDETVFADTPEDACALAIIALREQ